MGTKDVLVVEPDPAVATDVVRALEEAGLSVRHCMEGSRAAAILETERYKALIVEISLPSMNGLQVAAACRESQWNKKAPIFVASQKLDEAKVRRAAEIGVTRILSKPLDIGELVESVREVTGRDQHARQYDLRLVNAFVGATHTLIRSHLDCTASTGRPTIRQRSEPNVPVTGLISISSGRYQGLLALKPSRAIFRKFATLLGPTADPNDPQNAEQVIKSLCKEIANYVKEQLGSKSSTVHLNVLDPVSGKDQANVHETATAPILSVSVSANKEPLHLEISFRWDDYGKRASGTQNSAADPMEEAPEDESSNASAVEGCPRPKQ